MACPAHRDAGERKSKEQRSALPRQKTHFVSSPDSNIRVLSLWQTALTHTWGAGYSRLAGFCLLFFQKLPSQIGTLEGFCLFEMFSLSFICSCSTDSWKLTDEKPLSISSESCLTDCISCLSAFQHSTDEEPCLIAMLWDVLYLNVLLSSAGWKSSKTLSHSEADVSLCCNLWNAVLLPMGGKKRKSC